MGRKRQKRTATSRERCPARNCDGRRGSLAPILTAIRPTALIRFTFDVVNISSIRLAREMAAATHETPRPRRFTSGVEMRYADDRQDRHLRLWGLNPSWLGYEPSCDSRHPTANSSYRTAAQKKSPASHRTGRAAEFLAHETRIKHRAQDRQPRQPEPSRRQRRRSIQRTPAGQR